MSANSIFYLQTSCSGLSSEGSMLRLRACWRLCNSLRPTSRPLALFPRSGLLV